jgi:hypothetical protein
MIIKNWLIAVVAFNSNQRSIRIDDTIYTFTPKNGVSIAWVKPEHLEYLLNLSIPLCCGKTKKLCSLASDEQVNTWSFD